MDYLLRKTFIKWIGMTLIVMSILPFVVAKVVSECAGMVWCMMLFFVINPIYSIIIGIVAGHYIKELWNLPLITAVAFLAGTWLIFDIHEPWFIVYAGVYLGIGVIVMLITNFLNNKQ